MSDSQLSRNLLVFGRLLRRLGLPVTPLHLASLAEALADIGLERKEDVRAAARALLVSRREHLAPFERAFDLFWHAGVDAASDPGDRLHPSRPAGPNLKLLPGIDDDPRPTGPAEPALDITGTWSPREMLRQKDFALLDHDEVGAVRRAIDELDLAPPSRSTRRFRAARRGSRLDPGRTLRRALGRGGEVVELERQRRRQKPRRLVVLCDISGSMEAYARIFLQFLYVLSRTHAPVETFLFGTRLTRVTRAFRGRRPGPAVSAAARAAKDWAGGTRIGEALHDFNYVWGRRVLGGGATVLIMSDGWDRGDFKLLEREMRRLTRLARSVWWLSPLLGVPGYRPVTRGLEVALPCVDRFLPIHNLASLEELTASLRATDRRWPTAGAAQRV